MCVHDLVMVSCCCCRVDGSSMGLVCGVGFMGAPVILVEKLVGGDETVLAFTRLQQVVASGVCEGNGDGKTEQVRVTKKMYEYFDGTSFPISLACDEDLRAISLDSVPLVRTYEHMYIPTSLQ